MSKNKPVALNQNGVSIFIPQEVIDKEKQHLLLKNITIKQIGFFNNAKKHFLTRDAIPEYVVIYCVEGKGWTMKDEVKQDVSKGDLLFLDINKPHSYGAYPNDPWIIHWAHIVGDELSEIHSIICENSNRDVVHLGTNTEMQKYFVDSFNALSNGYTLSNMLFAAASMQMFFYSVIKNIMNPVINSESNIDIEKIVAFMYENIQNKLTLSEIAGYSKLSKFYFLRRFKESTGYTPLEYFTRLKIQKGCEFINTTNLSISQISDYLGYNNAFYFSEAFKKVTGYCPREYGKRKKSGL